MSQRTTQRSKSKRSLRKQTSQASGAGDTDERSQRKARPQTSSRVPVKRASSKRLQKGKSESRLAVKPGRTSSRRQLKPSDANGKQSPTPHSPRISAFTAMYENLEKKAHVNPETLVRHTVAVKRTPRAEAARKGGADAKASQSRPKSSRSGARLSKRPSGRGSGRKLAAASQDPTGQKSRRKPLITKRTVTQRTVEVEVPTMTRIRVHADGTRTTETVDVDPSTVAQAQKRPGSQPRNGQARTGTRAGADPRAKPRAAASATKPKPNAARPGGRPASSKPPADRSRGRPAGTRPAGTRPPSAKPGGPQPASVSRPASAKPTGPRSAGVKPANTIKPAATGRSSGISAPVKAPTTRALRRGRGRAGAARFKGKLQAKSDMADLKLSDEHVDKGPAARKPKTKLAQDLHQALQSNPLKKPKQRTSERPRPSPRAPPKANLEFVNEDDAKAALKEVGDSKSDTVWAVLTVKGNNLFEFTAKGTAHGDEGFEEVKQIVQDDQVQFVLFNISASDGGFAGQPKVAMIVWLGENAKAIFKARSGPQRVELGKYSYSMFTVAAEVMMSERDELRKRNIVSHMIGAKGSVGAAKVDVEVEAKKALDEDAAAARRAKEQKAAEERFRLAGRTTTDLEFDGKEEIANSLKELADSDAEFVALTLTGSTMRTVKVEEVGTNFVTKGESTPTLDPSFVDNFLRKDNVTVLVFKISSSEKGYGMQTKLVVVSWIGAGVKHLLHAKAREVFPAVQHYIYNTSKLPIAGELEASNADEVSWTSLMQKWSGSRVRGKESVSVAKPDHMREFGKSRAALTIEDEDGLRDILDSMILGDEQIKVEDADKVESPAWVCLTFKEGEAHTMVVNGTGKIDSVRQVDEVPEYHALLRPNNICFLLHRTLTVPEHLLDYSSQYVQPHYHLIRWQGPECHVMETALSSHHWERFAKLVNNIMLAHDAALQPGHYRVSDLKELTPAAIKASMNMK